MHEQQLCTWHELSTIYSLEDLRLMHLALDVSDDLAIERARRAQARNQ